MSRRLLLLLSVLLVLLSACEAGKSAPVPTEAPAASATPTPISPYAIGTVVPTSTATPEHPIRPPSKREWAPLTYAEGTYNRLVPPDLDAALEEGERYPEPRLPAQLDLEAAGAAPQCPSMSAAEIRTGDWLVDPSRFEADGILLATPTYAPSTDEDEITDHLLLRARHLESGDEHMYEAERHALYDAEHVAVSGDLVRYGFLPEFPRSGEWFVILTHGPNWGCLTLDVPEQVTRPFTFDIEAAEAAGAAFPRRRGVPERLHPSFSNPEIRGWPERACFGFGPDDVEQNEQGVRSGEWSIEGWWSNFERWVPDRGGKLPLVPYWQDEMNAPAIRAVRMGDRATTVIWQHADGWAFGGDGEPGHRFFPTTFVFPHEGTWLMVVESAPNWGCYIVEYVVGGVTSPFR